MTGGNLGLHGDVLARGAAVDLAVNVVAGGPPPWLRTALQAALDDLGAYPDETTATAAVARRHGRSPDEVVLLNGAAQGFWLVAQAVRARRPVVVHPSFTEPEIALRAAHRNPRRLVLAPPWTLDPELVPAAADLVVVGNPTNPTGVLHPRAALAALCRDGRVTVVDEAFMDLVPGEPASLTADSALPGLVVVRSLTKLLGMPGLRAGYLLAPAHLATRLREARPAWSVSTPALAAIAAAAAHPEHADAIARATATARADLAERLAAAGFDLHPGAANFVLARRRGARALAERLLREHSIALRPCHTFPGLGDDHVRVTVRDPAIHARLAAALA